MTRENMRKQEEERGRGTGPFRVWTAVLAAVLVLGLLAAGWYRQQHMPVMHAINGLTMGSTWSLRVAAAPDLDMIALQSQLEMLLAELNQQLSGYRNDSALMQLNNAPVGQWVALPKHLAVVLRFGRQLNLDSHGAFDMTVRPLVLLWGFGAAEPRNTLPTDAEIAAARAHMGADRIEISADGKQVRRTADVSVDVDAIAPGYAADVLSAWLDAHDLPNHLVEVGGEMRAEGERPDGSGWHVGIERPIQARGDIEQVVVMHAGGLATSGDYRDYFTVAGRRYSHTLDPVTGRPADNALALVSVIAPDGLSADGYATVLMVMGPDRGMAWAETRRLPVFMVERTADGGFHERYNEAFRSYLAGE